MADLVVRSFALAGMQQVVRTPAAVGSLLAVVEEQHIALAPAHHTVPVAVLEVARIAAVDHMAVEKGRRIVLVVDLLEVDIVVAVVVHKVVVGHMQAAVRMAVEKERHIVLVADLLEEDIAVAVVVRKVVVGHMQAAVRMAAAQDTVLLVVVRKT